MLQHDRTDLKQNDAGARDAECDHELPDRLIQLERLQRSARQASEFELPGTGRSQKGSSRIEAMHNKARNTERGMQMH